MEKQVAINLFGSGAALGRALGVSRQSISQLPGTLPQAVADRVVGAVIRSGRLTPQEILREFPEYRAAK